MPGEDDPGLFKQGPERLPGRIVEFRLNVGDLQIDLAHPAFHREARQLGHCRIRSFREHRHTDQAIGRRRAEIRQPVVVDAVARLAQHRILGRDLEDRAKDDLRLDPIAVHVSQPQFGDRRPPGALIVYGRAIEGIVERLDRSRRTVRWRLPAPAAPDLAVADPHGLALAFLDMGRPIAQRGRQPCGPQIRRQLAQIHMVVARD